MTIKSFSDLWNDSEKLLQLDIVDTDSTILVKELIAKINIYDQLSTQKNIPPQELNKLKTVCFGEVILCLTKLSSKDNINAYEALGNCLNIRAHR